MKIHHCRFFEPPIKHIRSLSCSELIKPSDDDSFRYLSVLRNDGSIELWRAYESGSFIYEKSIPGTKQHSPASSFFLSTSDQLLLVSSGMHAAIDVCNVSTLEKLSSTDSNGGSIWCMKLNNQPAPSQTIATGCEDGMVRLFRFDHEEIRFDYFKAFSKIDARILCIDWSKDNSFIIAGCDDATIRKYDVSSGISCLRMTLENVPRFKTMVWSVCCQSDGTFVSGDSTGTLTRWDSQHGTVLQSLNAHEADLTGICLDEEERVIITVSVDRKVNKFVVTPKGDWICEHGKRGHAHDVHDVCFVGEKVVSGGVEGSLVVVGLDNFRKQLPYAIMPQFSNSDLVSISSEQRLLAGRYDNKIRIWEVGKFEQNCRPLLEIRVFKKESINCFCLSKDGKLLVVANDNETRFYFLERHGAYVAVRKSLSLRMGASHLAFSPDSRTLILCRTDNRLFVLSTVGLESVQEIDDKCVCKIWNLMHLSQESIVNVAQFKQKQERHATVTQLKISIDGQWLGVTSNSSLFIFHLETLHFYAVFPQTSFITSIAFHPTAAQIFIYTASSKLISIDMETKTMLHTFDDVEKGNVRLSCFATENGVRLLKWKTNGSVDRVNFENPAPKRQRDGQVNQGIFSKISNLKAACFLHVDAFNSEEVICVERTAASIAAEFPPAVYHHNFGS